MYDFSEIDTPSPITRFTLTNASGQTCSVNDSDAVIKNADGTTIIVRPPNTMYGQLSSIDPSAPPAFGYWTGLNAINDRGIVVGSYTDTAGAIHGFSFDTNTGSYLKIDVPGSTATWVQGVDVNGNITGLYNDAQGFERPFWLTKTSTPPLGLL